MADKEQGGGEGGQPTAGGAGWVKLSDFYPYGDGPPRLCAGLNDTLTDASETAVFTPTTKARTITRGKTTKIEAEGPPMEAPQRDEVADPYQAEVVHKILEWVAHRLDLGLSGAWLSQIGQVVEWAPSGGPEEGWAQAITEMFLGVTYAGAGQTYQMGAPQKRNAAGALVATKDSSKSERWEPMIFRRIGRKQWQRKGDPYGLQSWENPVPFEKDGDAPNTDPAISIGTACQHLSTYAVITRGIPFDAAGNATTSATGLMASDANWEMPLFGGRGYDLPSGKSEKLAGFRLPKPRPKPKAGDPATDPTPEETVGYYLDVKNAIAAGLGPGSVAVYDPDRGTATSPPQVYMTAYELNKYGPDNVAVYAKYLKNRMSNEDVSKFDTRATKEDWTDKDRPFENPTSNTGPRMLVPFPTNQQFGGSHIYSVLRKHPTKPLVQLLDVNVSDNMKTLKDTGSDGLMVQQGEGIVDGCGRSKLYEMDNGFAGLGVLPPHQVDQAQVDFLRTARPVGLGRVAITRRVSSKTAMTNDDILYVGRLMRLYGDAPDKNYTVARLLWSLRNTPGFTDLQVWWFIYAPRRLLAKAMWAHGARSMRLSDFVTKHGEFSTDDLLLSVVITNHGLPPYAGHAAFYSRFKSHPVGSSTVVDFRPQEPPPALMRHVNQYRPSFLPWNACYVHPKIHLDEGKLPRMFQAGG